MPCVDTKRMEHEIGFRRETIAAKEFCCYLIRM
jgi:hypothetical protein